MTTTDTCRTAPRRPAEHTAVAGEAMSEVEPTAVAGEAQEEAS